MENKSKGRPSQNKTRISITIDRDVLKNAKLIANSKHQNLSNYIEELCILNHKETEEILKDPLLFLNNLENQINNLKEINKIQI